MKTRTEKMYKALRKNRKKLPGWVILPILGCVVLVFFAVSRLFAGEGEAQISVVTAEKGDIRQVYHASGTVESEQMKVFYSPVNAPVQACSAKVGSAVKKGDLLVAFDVTNLERDNQQSELNALSAKYTNEDALEQSSRAAQAAAAGAAQAEESAAQIRAEIQEKEGEISSLEKQAASESSQTAQNASKAASLRKQMQENLDAQSEQKAVKENAERQLEKLDETDPGSSAQIQQLLSVAQGATDKISSLEKTYRSLESQLNSLGSTEGSGVSQYLAAARKELETLQTSLRELESSAGAATADTGVTSGQKKNMEVTEELARLTQMSTEELLEKGREGIKAEYDGIISDVKVLEGSTATQGMELFTLVSNQDVKVRLEVPANDFDHLAQGSKAEITIGENSYQGILESVDKIALTNEKGSSVIHADVSIADPDQEICVGVGAKVTLTVAEKQDVLYVPNEVVNTSAQGDFVYVIRGGQVEKQPVELGIASDSRAEIVSGLEEGDEVISDVSGNVHEGMKATGLVEESEEE